MEYALSEFEKYRVKQERQKELEKKKKQLEKLEKVKA